MKIKFETDYIVIDSVYILDRYSKDSRDLYRKIVPKTSIINKHHLYGIYFHRHYFDLDIYIMDVVTPIGTETFYTRSYDEYIEARIAMLDYTSNKLKRGTIVYA